MHYRSYLLLSLYSSLTAGLLAVLVCVMQGAGDTRMWSCEVACPRQAEQGPTAHCSAHGHSGEHLEIIENIELQDLSTNPVHMHGALHVWLHTETSSPNNS